MVFLYNLGIAIYGGLVALASLFYTKASLWYNGRKNWESKLRQNVDPGQRPIWIHCSSLGEFEQGRPIIEAIKQQNPNQKILLTFFSPSGYEVRKNYANADYILYLPLDTKRNARAFIEIANPQKAIFIKYEFWYHYLNQLHSHNIPTYIVSAIFRPEQAFFKSYGGWYQKFLKRFTHLFVQDEESKTLLGTIGISNVTVTGDTRFDRVLKIVQDAKKLPIVEAFCAGEQVIVAGSSWPKDEDFLVEYMKNSSLKFKLVIAPHEVHESHIQEIITKFGKACIRYSTATPGQVSDCSVLIIDTIGILSSVYGYGSIAHVGGGFGVGIHNTLEAAAYGMPVVFGPNYKRFREAVELIACGGGFTFDSSNILKMLLDKMLSDSIFLNRGGHKAKNYVLGGKGASEKILHIIG